MDLNAPSISDDDTLWEYSKGLGALSKEKGAKGGWLAFLGGWINRIGVRKLGPLQSHDRAMPFNSVCPLN